MMTKVDLYEVLAIYFDLTDRPLGGMLVTGDLSITEYIDTKEKDAKRRIVACEKRLQEEPHRIMRAHLEKRLRESTKVLERIKVWRERGYIG